MGTPSGNFADPSNWFLVTSGDIGGNGTAPNGPTVEAEMLTVAGTPVALTVTTAVTLTILDILTHGGPTPSLTISGAGASLTVSNINLETPVGVRLPNTWPTGTGANVLFSGPASATIGIGGGGTLNLGDTSGTQLTIDFLDGNGNTYSNTSPVTFGGVVSGFSGTDALDFPLVPFDLGLGVTASVQYNPATHVLSVIEPHSPGFPPAPSYFVQMDASFAGGASSFGITADAQGHVAVELASALCFCAGTLIATPAGETPVERLAVGDLVLTNGGKACPVVWIGEGRVLATSGRRTAATQVIVRKGALADNVPHQDLHVTKGHSLYLDGALIPAEFLVNYRSILWDDRALEVQLYHIELERHDVLLANGAPAESYRDDGNRWLFANANTGWNLPPQTPYAPVLTGGPVVDAIWRRLLARAGGPLKRRTTDDPDLHLLVDGVRIDGAQRLHGGYVFDLPKVPAEEVRVISRVVVPSELGSARDPRTLGVALRQIMVWQGPRMRLIEPADPSLRDGFHGFEPHLGARWTSGAARLPAALFNGLTGPCQLELRVGCTARYPRRHYPQLAA
jgi:hypothetical protein